MQDTFYYSIHEKYRFLKNELKGIQIGFEHLILSSITENVTITEWNQSFLKLYSRILEIDKEIKNYTSNFDKVLAQSYPELTSASTEMFREAKTKLEATFPELLKKTEDEIWLQYVQGNTCLLRHNLTELAMQYLYSFHYLFPVIGSLSNNTVTLPQEATHQKESRKLQDVLTYNLAQYNSLIDWLKDDDNSEGIAFVTSDNKWNKDGTFLRAFVDELEARKLFKGQILNIRSRLAQIIANTFSFSIDPANALRQNRGPKIQQHHKDAFSNMP